MASLKTAAVLCLLILASVLVFAAVDPISDLLSPNSIPGSDPRPHGAMEIFGVGPEMFQDRSVAWAKAIGTFVGELISQFGIQAAAVLLVVSNLRNKKAIDQNAHRLDRQREDLNHVAAVAQVPLPSQQTPPPSTAPPTL